MSSRHFLDSGLLVKALRSKGITNVFHANSIETSISFLRTGGLLSRQECQRCSLHMSAQYTDAKDQKYGIFNDLFFNYRDLHTQYKKPNNYGPVTFRVSIDNLELFFNEVCSQVSVTTGYLPHSWKDNDSVDDRWIKDAARIFDPPHPDIVISHPVMDFKYVDEIIVDRISDKPLFFDQVQALFENCLKAHGLKAAVVPRACTITGCECVSSQNIKFPIRYRAGSYKGTFGPLDDVA